MMITTQALSIELYKATSWTTLYWWNLKKQDGKTSWTLDSKKAGNKSIPAYNFDFLFEKLRPVLALQDASDLLAAFRLMLKVQNPADALAKLALELAKKGYLK